MCREKEAGEMRYTSEVEPRRYQWIRYAAIRASLPHENNKEVVGRLELELELELEPDYAQACIALPKLQISIQ
jgi:hypothetical protein